MRTRRSFARSRRAPARTNEGPRRRRRHSWRGRIADEAESEPNFGRRRGRDDGHDIVGEDVFERRRRPRDGEQGYRFAVAARPASSESASFDGPGWIGAGAG